MKSADSRIRNLVRRVDRARCFPGNTCAASRHVQMMAVGLMSKPGYPMLLDEPEHCAESLLAVVEALWKARIREQRLRVALASARSAKKTQPRRKS